MVGPVDNEVADAKASHAAAGAMAGPGGLDVGRQGGELVGHDAHLPGALPLAGNRMTSGGVLLSLLAQKGPASTNGGTTLAGRLLANSSGRLARSVAMMTHSLVK